MTVMTARMPTPFENTTYLTNVPLSTSLTFRQAITIKLNDESLPIPCPHGATPLGVRTPPLYLI